MLGILNDILCAITNVAWWIADLLVLLLNGFFALLGALVMAVLSILPDMPDLPAAPGGEILQWVNWMFPVAELLLIFALYFGLYIAARIVIAAIKLADRLAGLGPG